MQQSTLKIDPESCRFSKRTTPKYLSLTGCCQPFALQFPHPTRLTPSLRWGASRDALSSERELLIEKKKNARARYALEGQKRSTPSQSGSHPMTSTRRPQSTPTLIRDYLEAKKGSKHRAWSILQKGLLALQEKYGDDVGQEQLELGINGRWNGITLKNYEEFDAKRSHRPGQSPEPEVKHPAHKVFRASDLGPEWQNSLHDQNEAAAMISEALLLMERPWDEGSIARVLRRGIENGHFTVEDLDDPPRASKRTPDPTGGPSLTVTRAFSTATSCEATQAPHSRTERPLRTRPNIYPDPIRIRIPTSSDGHPRISKPALRTQS